MLISGFTFARNTHKLGYPLTESIKSILPVCDEFVVAVGKGEDDDRTRELITNINDPKLKIIDTEWTDLDKLRSRIYSQQTNIALNACRGIWCFYLQSDEIIHERYLQSIHEACYHFATYGDVDGFLFRYKHFWGDYDHYFINHRWYPREIRIIRNGRGIVSVGDAQSFRYDTGTKVPVVNLDAEVFHYGHVRDPRKVNIRKQVVNRIYRGAGAAVSEPVPIFDYGSLEKLPVYRGGYPAVMKEVVTAMNWKQLLRYSGTSSVKLPHDRFKYRLLTFIEQRIFRGSGREFWGYKPYRILRKLSRYYRSSTKSDLVAPPVRPPAASLIIAVYNRPDFLEKVFCSLRNQTVSDFEIIIADDGSGVAIAELVARYEGSFMHPIRHVWHDDDGFRKTVIVNKAVRATSAPYCIFIDGDCILHHRFIEFHLKRKQPGAVLTGRRVMMNDKLSTQITPGDIATKRIEAPHFWWKNCNKAGHRHGLFIPGIFHLKNIARRKVHDILGANFSVHKDDFLKVNGYDERIIGRGLEDDNLSIRLSMAGTRAKTVCNEAIAYHLHHSFDPIPHNDEFKKQFRDNPGTARTPYGIVREK